jgi:hypothetical protein
MKITTEEIYENGKDPRVEVLLVLEGLGEKALPEHVLAAIGDAAEKVVLNFRREGTPCGHQQWAETGFCATMICPQYVARHRREGKVR